MFDPVTSPLATRITNAQNLSRTRLIRVFYSFSLLSHCFISLCVRWLNKLGMAAQHGYKVVLRHTMLAGEYSLLGKDLEPNPVS